MQQREKKKLQYSDIGYQGKPIDALNKEELLKAFLEVTQLVYNCASTNNQCKAMLTIKQDQ
ncbi:hypothetical protein ACFL2E_06220 [Thermodesulfobacteriota bacterium]